MRKEMIELKATNKVLLTTISRQESRLKNEYVRQQKLESLVQALQSQLQEVKETKELEDQLKVAILKEISGYDESCKSLITVDPALSLEDRVKLLESALHDEKLCTANLRQQLDTASRYLREVTNNSKSRVNLTSPNKITYHRTVFMKSMLPSTRQIQDQCDEKSIDQSDSNE
jgi:hypothetical protein